MKKSEIIQKIAEFIKNKFEKEEAAHDWFHIERVWKTAKTINKAEKADSFIVELGALLHDIEDHKNHNGDHSVGPKAAGELLKTFNVDEETVEKVKHIVGNVSFTSSLNNNGINSKEGQVVQDADRLDAMGAIGIARVFAYTGHKDRPIYDPEKPYNLEKYKKEGKSLSAINHFYEKLLLIGDLMNTETGKKFAKNRTEFMRNYLDQFFAEWEGEK